jgi:signal transduction histidine kinase/CheY-like chemotaxis protein
MFGYAEDELPGIRMDALFDPTDARPMREDAENPVWRLHGRRKDGAVFPIGMQARRLERSRHLTVVVLSDLARAGTGMEANGKLLATASHDLRQPLQTLRLLNQSLAESVDAPELRELVEHQAQAIGTMGGLVDALLDLSKLDAGAVSARPTDMDLGVLFAALEKEFAPLATARGLALVVDGKAPMIRSDPVLLGQILRNLLGNALKFTERGEVRLSAARTPVGIRVTVADTGVGISQTELPRLWDEFYRVSRPASRPVDGYGLGLSIVRRLADLIDARLSIESEPGNGTRVLIDVPVSAASAQVVSPRSQRERPQLLAEARNVLLVEDDAGLRYATRRWLSGRGLRIEAVADGPAALDLLARGFAPDLVVSDLHLADGETATDVIGRVRAAAGRDIPALVLSGDSSPSAQAAARIAGIGLLLKPVDPEELLERIRALLA